MKKINFLMMIAFAAITSVLALSSCSKDDNNVTDPQKEIVHRFVSEYTHCDSIAEVTKAASKHDEAILLVAFGSTWNNAFLAFDKTVEAYKTAFPSADVFIAFSSDICINRASIGENVDENDSIVKRDYYAPNYWLHAIGAAKYNKVTVQSLQVIPGEEFAAVVASIKKFGNNGYINNVKLDDEYLSKVELRLGMPLLATEDVDVPAVAEVLNNAYKDEAAKGAVAFMGHGNPDSYDTFKANIRYSQLEESLKAYSTNYYVGTVDMPGNYKQNVFERMGKPTTGSIYLHALMSIAGDHAHNDMAGEGEDYWDEKDPESEENSWAEYFSHHGMTVYIPVVNKHPLGLLEIPGILNIWIQHTKDAELLEDAYHSMYPEE